MTTTRVEAALASETDCLVIGEVGQAHDGDLDLAHRFIDVIAEAGAGAVKFQTHIAAAESTRDEPWRVRFSTRDADRFDYWKRMEFTEDEWRELREHTLERDLAFLSSPFSLEAIELLESVGLDAWKVASGEVGNAPLLERMLDASIPILVSSGMSDYDELDRALDVVKSGHAPFAVLQCTSAYPVSPGQVGLNMLDEFRTRYGCPVGLSDHSGTTYPGLAAAALGAQLVEVHVTLSRDAQGPDVAASLTPDELRTLVEGVAFIVASRAAPLDKSASAEEMSEMRALFTKSLALRHDLEAGAVLKEEDLTLKKPGTGMSPDLLRKVVGRVLARPVSAERLLKEEDLVS
jgi:N-acetylneuraminate synthase